MKRNRSRGKEPVTVRHRRQIGRINTSRWAIYATAGAATALGCAPADANIIYSGPVNHHFDAPPGGSSVAAFPLDQPGRSLFGVFDRSDRGKNGAAEIFIFASAGGAASIAGFVANPLVLFKYASKLSFGQSVNTRPFVSGYGRMALFPEPVEGLGYNAQWLDPGTGFVGFRFNGGSGLQYGWARINADGQPGNSFTLIDYAFAGPGERITAGQTTTASVPESGGSLGLLALGCAGLLAWRTLRGRDEGL